MLDKYTDGREFALHLYEIGYIFDNLSSNILSSLNHHLGDGWVKEHILTDNRLYKNISHDILSHLISKSADNNDIADIIRKVLTHSEEIQNDTLALLEEMLKYDSSLFDNPNRFYHTIFKKYIGETLKNEMPRINNLLYNQDEDTRVELMRILLSNPENPGAIILSQVYTFIA